MGHEPFESYSLNLLHLPISLEGQLQTVRGTCWVPTIAPLLIVGVHAETPTILVKGDFLFSFSFSSREKKTTHSVAIFYRNGGLSLAGSRRVPQNVTQSRLRVSQLPPVTHLAGPFFPMSHLDGPRRFLPGRETLFVVTRIPTVWTEWPP